MTSEFDKIEDIQAIVKGQFDFKKRYSNLEVLGEGGMGKVFRAYDKKLAKLVAIKFLHSHADFKTILRFQQEARALSRLSHQFIVNILDFRHSEDGELFLVMEYVEGKSLESILQEKGQLLFADAIRYTIQLCEALEHAHLREIVHRDLKPGNILIDANNNVRILDFGLAKLVHYEDPFGTMTRPGQMIGTPLYMSPEQVLGEATDLRADVYGLGTILYAMLAGRTPWDGEQVVVMFREKISGELPSLWPWIGETHTANQLDRIVATALRRDPDQRFQSMKQFREELCAVVENPVEMKQITAKSGVRKPRWLTRKTLLVAAAAAAGFILFICPAWFFSFYSSRPIDANLAKVAEPLSGFSEYDVVQRTPVESTIAKETAEQQPSASTRRKTKEPEQIPGFFRQTERKEQLGFWFARPYVNDEMLARLDPRIQELSLEGNTRVTDEGLRAIPAGQLKRIDLTETNITDESLKIVAQMQNLYWIRLNNTAITDGGIKNLAPLAKELQRLDVDQCKGFTNSSLQFVLDTFPNIYALQIGDTSVTRSGIKQLEGHQNLRELWLSSIGATDDDIRSLGHLNLRLLDLTLCPQLTDEIFNILAEQNLGNLDLIGCPKITANGVNAWKKRHPRTEVNWQDEKEADSLTESGLLDAPEQVE